jgi:aldehyde:ferredoxin oxidoreductase
MYFPEIPELADFGDPHSEDMKLQLAMKAENFGRFFNHSVIWCKFGCSALNATQALRFFNLVNGFDNSLGDLMERGEKIWYLKREIDNLFGVQARDDRLPEKQKHPFQTALLKVLRQTMKSCSRSTTN